eukprot:NODE_17_length_48642_cov_1.199349.p18 type:complete len:313 gc:universal NODE_17_length_48642_cov_1.199349:41319-40381(-)
MIQQHEKNFQFFSYLIFKKSLTNSISISDYSPMILLREISVTMSKKSNLKTSISEESVSDEFEHNIDEPLTLEMIEYQLLVKQEFAKNLKSPTTVEDIEKDIIQVKAKSFKQSEKQGFVMNTNDQNFILKMAMSQIAITDEYDDDFYNNIYLMVRKELGDKSRQSSGDYLQLLVKGSKKKKKTFNQTLEKIVEKKKANIGISFVIEGALGKVSSATSKKPRQAIDIPIVNIDAYENKGVLDGKLPLKYIEDIYESVIELETWKRKAKRLQNHDVSHSKTQLTSNDIEKNVFFYSEKLSDTIECILNRYMLLI